MLHATPLMNTVTNFFIVNLAVGDILMTLFYVPFSFVSMLVLRYWPFGLVMCKIVNYSKAVLVFVSAYTLLAISIDRYMAIMRPLKPPLGKAAAKMMVTIIWFGALAMAATIPIVSKLQRPSPWHEACEVDVCGEQWSNTEQSLQYTCALLAVQFALPMGAVVCTYARIAHFLWGGRPPGEAQPLRESRMQNSNRKMIKMMVTVVAVFTICWLPLNVFIVIWTVNKSNDEWIAWPGMPYVWFANHWLAMSHSCYNPIIYYYMNARYRRGFKQLLGRCRCLKLNESGRNSRRSSIYEGIPLSEMRGLSEQTTISRRTVVGCNCKRLRNDVTIGVSKCRNCELIRELKVQPSSSVTRAPSPPARIVHAVHSHFLPHPSSEDRMRRSDIVTEPSRSN